MQRLADELMCGHYGRVTGQLEVAPKRVISASATTQREPESILVTCGVVSHYI
jgi:hypothetical protein